MRKERDIQRDERQIQRAIVTALKLSGYRVTRVNSGAINLGPRGFLRLAEPGTPDLLVRYQDRCLWLEVKRPGKKETAIQLAWRRAEEKAGGNVCTVSSVTDAFSVAHAYLVAGPKAQCE